MGGANGHVVAVARHEGNLYEMTFTEVCEVDLSDFGHSRVGGDSVELWHHRLGHLDEKSVYALQSMMKGISLGKISLSITTLVWACRKGKQYAACTERSED